MYQALYRKYRPRSFSDVAGQEHITETLRRQIVANRLSHAYLFVGTRGTGKTTCAKILSRAVNCLQPEDGNPCNKCISCIGIEDGSILDVLELDAASNNGVDDVRAMRDEAIYSPASVRKRVYIVDEVHMLSTPAFNALLKILEEPPEHIVFILATTELHKVPATILSRCQKFSFKRLPAGEISKRLLKIAASEKQDLTQEAAEKLSILADGSMRDGISLLDQCACDKKIDLVHVLDTIGLAGEDELLGMVKAVAKSDISIILDILGSLYADGKDMAALLSELVGFFRDMLVVSLSPDSALIGTGISRKELSDLSKTFTTERLLYCLSVSKDALFSLSRGGISRLTLEMCLIKMCIEENKPATSGNALTEAVNNKSAEDAKSSSLDKLSAFDIVKFE
ncbi:MAG: DNA polymerase III subunit gamma/tau [Oscillospiraceae bacterium]|nr:DNA polymerase III subunit gamma/tau [Oscillospiraceae bacterium]